MRPTQVTSGDPFSAPVIVDGQVVGTWRRRLEGDTVIVTVTRFTSLSRTDASAIADAARVYANFRGLGLDLGGRSRKHQQHKQTG